MIDPYSLKRPESSEETRTFTENGTTLAVTLRKGKDFGRKMRATENARTYIARYITGEVTTGEDGIERSEVSTLRPVQGIIPTLSTETCYCYANLETMQVPAPGEELYRFDQWAAFSVAMPETTEAIYQWVLELTTAGKDDAKNDSGAAAAP